MAIRRPVRGAAREGGADVDADDLDAGGVDRHQRPEAGVPEGDIVNPDAGGVVYAEQERPEGGRAPRVAVAAPPVPACPVPPHFPVGIDHPSAVDSDVAPVRNEQHRRHLFGCLPLRRLRAVKAEGPASGGVPGEDRGTSLHRGHTVVAGQVDGAAPEDVAAPEEHSAAARCCAGGVGRGGYSCPIVGSAIAFGAVFQHIEDARCAAGCRRLGSHEARGAGDQPEAQQRRDSCQPYNENNARRGS